MTPPALLDDLSRPGLAPAVRLTVLMGHALAPGEWNLLAALVRALRQVDGARAVFDEALLQATLFFGFPRVVTAFGVVAEEWPRDPVASPDPGGLDPEFWPAAGRDLFGSIYGRNDTRVRAMLKDYHPAFHDFVIESAYGRVLARPELDVVTRELLAVGWLAVLDQEPQAIAHGRGALALGANAVQLREALWSGLREPDRVERWMARIERRTG